MLWVLIRRLEAPRRGTSNEYHNICFRGEIRKILCGYPLLSVAMEVGGFVGCQGYVCVH